MFCLFEINISSRTNEVLIDLSSRMCSQSEIFSEIMMWSDAAYTSLWEKKVRLTSFYKIC